MKTRAAVLWGLEQKWEVEEVDLDPPGPGEVLVRLAATGLCHSARRSPDPIAGSGGS